MLRALVTAMSPLRWLLVLLGGLLVCPGPAFAEEPALPKRVDRAHTSGPAIAIGTGTQTVVIGGQLLYYFQLPSPRWRVALHLGAGGIPVPDDPFPRWGMNGGAFFGMGRHHHRLVVGVEAGTVAWATYSLHGASMAMRQVPGIGASVGWEWMSSFGLFVRGSVGPAIMIERGSPLQDRDVSPWFVASWVLGYKPW
jgi:hypothetical protein